jgi:hypothetical protein
MRVFNQTQPVVGKGQDYRQGGASEFIARIDRMNGYRTKKKKRLALRNRTAPPAPAGKQGTGNKEPVFDA